MVGVSIVSTSFQKFVKFMDFRLNQLDIDLRFLMVCQLDF